MSDQVGKVIEVLMSAAFWCLAGLGLMTALAVTFCVLWLVK